ncbi:MAG: DUF1186 domain-containing protein [Desulfobacteraceae bacterium]|nr:DUF1186 domain-containing protein [Desulfobacteraceae bacterium]
MNDKIVKILDSFKICDGIYKREYVEAALVLKDEITPSLIDILEKLLLNPHEYTENQELYDHIYGVMLLGHFKEPLAHELIIDIFSLPDDLPDSLFGDISTSDLPAILVNTCGGVIDHIKTMILNKNSDVYCRISACQALVYAVVEGYILRKEAVEFFGTLFTGDEADETSDFWGLLASITCDLCPKEITNVIQKGFENGVIMPGVIGYQEFERVLDQGEEYCLEKLKGDFDNHNLNDIHGSMSWWDCFKREKIHEKNPDHYLLEAAKKKKSKARKKSKQARASKKKNR